MSVIFLVLAIVAFILAACADFGTFGMTAEHVHGLIALGLVAFAIAHLPLGDYFRR